MSVLHHGKTPQAQPAHVVQIGSDDCPSNEVDVFIGRLAVDGVNESTIVLSMRAGVSLSLQRALIPLVSVESGRTCSKS